MLRRQPLLLAIAVAACADISDQPPPEVEAAAPPPAAAMDCADPAIRDLVRRFGERLRQVSLLAPDTVVSAEMRSAYGELVTPELLAEWQAAPADAPGRRVSSPWPQQIEISGIVAGASEDCVVSGEVIYTTSADTAATYAAGEGVTLTVREDDGWRISSYEAAEGVPSDTSNADTAAE